jgi:hypothetical protein
MLVANFPQLGSNEELAADRRPTIGIVFGLRRCRRPLKLSVERLNPQIS